MLEHNILKAFLDPDTYTKYRSTTEFSVEVEPWVKTIDDWFSARNTPLTVDDLHQLHLARHPVATKGQRDLMNEFVTRLKEVDTSTPVIEEVLRLKKQQEQYMDWAEKFSMLGTQKASVEDFLSLKTEIEEFDATKADSEFPALSITADDMLEASLKQGRWSLNLPVFQDKIGGIGSGVFALIAARPNSGKSLTSIHLCFGPKGWAEQGAKIVYLGNEEAIHRTKHRAICSWAGMGYKHSKMNPSEFKEKVAEFDEKFKDKVVFLHKSGMMYYDIEKLLDEHHPDILIIDQLDKLHVKGDAPAHEKMRIVYTTMREYSVNYECAIIGVCQASEAAAGKKFFGFDALEHSKTGKAAELDLCICIGKEDLQEDNNMRYFYLAKNKLTGDESSGSFMINKELSRMEV